LTVVGTFLTRFTDMVADWADWAAQTIEGWPDDPSQAQPDWEPLEQLAQRGRPKTGTAPPSSRDQPVRDNQAYRPGR